MKNKILFTLPLLLLMSLSANIININTDKHFNKSNDYPSINSNAEGNLSIIQGSEGDGVIKFYLDVDDVENQFYNAAIEQDDWYIKYQFGDYAGPTYEGPVTFLPEEMYPGNRFIFKVDLSEDNPELNDISTNYLYINSLNNFYLGIDGSNVKSKIEVDDHYLPNENLIITTEAITKYDKQKYLTNGRLLPLYEEQEEGFKPFEITKVDDENNYVDFTLRGIPESASTKNNINPFYSANNLDVLLKNKTNDSTEIKKASMIEHGTETTTDEKQQEYVTYEISDLGNNDYQFLNLVNSYFYVEDVYNSNFSLENDLGVPVENLEFTTIQPIIPDENSYIEEGSFIIEEDSITNNSFRFHLTIYEINNSFEEDELNLTIINNDTEVEGEKEFYLSAFLVSNSGTDYLYEVDGLSPNTSYTISSIDDTGLSVGSSLNEADNEILINDDLNSNGDFQTTINPYLAYDSFKIDDTTPGSADFTIEILFANGKEQDRLSVGLKDDTKLYTAKLQSVEGDKYTYKIVGLKSNTTYKIETIQNAEFAIDEEENEISNPIYLSDTVSDENLLEFKTPHDILLWILLIIIPIILIFIIWMFHHYHLIRKINKEIAKKRNDILYKN